MLEPREADINVLFIFFVVLPVVVYILLGKWNEISKKKARVNILAQMAVDEACSVEAMAVANVVQPVAMPNTAAHYCARCFGPAKTRCSRCKSVRYCSGKCQIIHWRQGHKQECEQWESQKKFSNVSNGPSSQNDSADANHVFAFSLSGTKEPEHDLCSLDTPSIFTTVGRRRSSEQDYHAKQESCRPHQGVGYYCLDEVEDVGASSTAMIALGDARRRRKLCDESCVTFEDSNDKQSKICQNMFHICAELRNTVSEMHQTECSTQSTLETTSGAMASLHSVAGSGDVGEKDLKIPTGNAHHYHCGFDSAVEDLDTLNGSLTARVGTKFRKPPYTIESSLSTPATKSSKGYIVNGIDKNSCKEKESSLPRPQSNTNCKSGDIKVTATKKTLPPKHGMDGSFVRTGKKSKSSKQVLFPFEELFKLFQCEIYDISPRGLLNCGNSCYANAVLQCLTCTKPLLVYLLRGMHSRSCCIKEWCLMCELELHVALLREVGGPLSPTKILSNMTRIGCHIGGGRQEDAHEYLRLLVMSMQSICLEGLGGEKKVDPTLQDTTLIQQIFGGCLQSKVKCLRCELESECYENIMDLTLEIHGWVESLEDALTQFTAPEELDGDNMYRCGRCSTYVTARKQLMVHEAPNILTIVLKRFQTGKYGKINKCVTFPDMLDMIPYMTGTSDCPPLYLLYAVVVHLDTLNASFSGHYISYVKDLQDAWFRIDDTEVQPVDLAQVMSEGAYMLFYSRSSPRPPWNQSCKYTTMLASNSLKPSILKPPKSLKHENGTNRFEKWHHQDTESNMRPEAISLSNDHEANHIQKNHTRCNLGRKENFLGSGSADFSDATPSSDWSVFTSSDESSFTTESTSDSFSTTDYLDSNNLDPVSSLFSPAFLPEYTRRSSVSCTKLPHCRPRTRFFSEDRGVVLDSWTSAMPIDTVHKGRNGEHLAAGGGSSYVRLGRAIPR